MGIYKYDSVKTLPDTYQQVEYIQSTATNPGTTSSSGQYIDTLFTPTSNTKVEMEFQYTNITSQSRMFGIQTESSSYMTFDTYINGSGYYARTMKDGAGDWMATTIAADTNKHKFEIDKTGYKIYTNGTQVYSQANSNTPTKNCAHTMPLFARWLSVESGTTYNRICAHSSAKLYNCKIWDNGTLVRDYVPCYRKSDGVIGLYDLVGDVFYTNAGTGTFTTSETLPNTYQKVEWIGGTGTQYINTGYTPSINTKIETEISWGTSQVEWAVFFGMTSSDSAPTGIIGRVYYNSSGGSTTWFNPWFCNALYGETIKVLACDTFHSITMEKNLATADGTDLPITSTGTPYSGNIFLFCGNNGGSAWRYGNCKFKKFKIYNNGTTVRNFIPCYRISDSVIGMYDSINGTFYTNAGSGTFTKGNNVS